MIRFILKKNDLYVPNQMRTESFYTVDVDCAELEHQLEQGGCGESGFTVITLIGAEVLK